MREWGQIKYRAGARWYCERFLIDGRPNFTFVIVGPGSRPNKKLCRLEFDNKTSRMDGITQEYSHKHLNKYAKYIEEKKDETPEQR